MRTATKNMIVVFMAIVMAMAFMPAINPTYAATKPAKVKITKVSVKGKTVTVKWKKAKGAKKYQVKAGKKVVKTTATTSAKFKVKKSCTIKVRGINGRKKGSYSKSRKAKIKKSKRYHGKTPAKVEGLKVSVNHYTHTATVTWKKAKYATKYQVYFKSNSDDHSSFTKTTSSTTLKQDVKTIDEGCKYNVSVRGVNGSKYGKWNEYRKGVFARQITYEINGSTLTEGKGGTVTLDLIGEVTFTKINTLETNFGDYKEFYICGTTNDSKYIEYSGGEGVDSCTWSMGDASIYTLEDGLNSPDFDVNPAYYNDDDGSFSIKAEISDPSIKIAWTTAPRGEKPSEPSLDMDEEYADFEDMHGATVTVPTNGIITYGGDMRPYKDYNISDYNLWIKVYKGDRIVYENYHCRLD